MTTLAPRPGCNPLMVNWGGPDEPRTLACSYCGDALPTEDEDPQFVPLILFRSDGWVAEFCDHCQARWFALQSFPEPRKRPTGKAI